MTVGHVLRIKRWELFIKIYEKPNTKNLMQSLAWGYLVNVFLPFRLGEIIRAYLSGRKMESGKVLGFSTVIIDRYLDIVAVACIFILLSLNSSGVGYRNSLQYIVLSVVLTFLPIFIYFTKSIVKKRIRGTAGLFNDNIELALLLFFWALIRNFKDIFLKINKFHLALYTIFMWIVYLLSYVLFANYLNSPEVHVKGFDVFNLFFSQNIISSNSQSNWIFLNDIIGYYPLKIIFYLMILPNILLLSLSFIVKKNRDEVKEDEENYIKLLPQINASDRLNFLDDYFSNKNREFIKNYLKINQEVSIIRDYSAGSNATTILCLDEIHTFFRKYAFNADAEKLFEQIKWIKSFSNSISLPEIIRQEKNDIYCYYDMPYKTNCVSLFEYAHSTPVEKSWNIIKAAFESLEKSIYKIDLRKADDQSLIKYIKSKVENNLKQIKEGTYIKNLLKYDCLKINGEELPNLSFYEKYLSAENLQEYFKQDNYSVIHGDMTIENIICTRDDNGEDSFYIIDPNTGNIHDSPNLDYAKMLQSIHGGYEFLMSTKSISIKGNEINFLFTRSTTYKELHKKFKTYMITHFEPQRVKSIYFHEIVHWLRLVPYKIKKDGKRSVLFYAGMLMIMNDIYKEFIEKH